MEERIGILVADGHSLFREALVASLNGEADLDVVGTAGDGVQAVAEAERLQPDVAIIDVALPNCDGIRVTAQIKQRVRHCNVLVLDSEDEVLLLRSIEAGASGFLSRSYPLSELKEAARAIHRGEALIPRRMLAPLLSRLVERRNEHGDAVRLVAQLTRREKEVLGLIASGSDKDGIAQVLVISPQTARTHIQNILAKLGLHSQLEAAAFATRTGVLEQVKEMAW
jgi:DNA-binding NarL/FixJ family response regulator